MFWGLLVCMPIVMRSDTVGAHFFCIDQQLLYGPFFTDFGPLNLGCTYRFCMMLKAKLKDPKLKDKVIYFYCSSKPQHKANAACLIGLFSVLYLNKSPADAYKPLKPLGTHHAHSAQHCKALHCTRTCTQELTVCVYVSDTHRAVFTVSRCVNGSGVVSADDTSRVSGCGKSIETQIL